MNIRYPETILTKSPGFTKSESYLIKKCEKTFLALWSYPNPFKKQRDAKELCDVLVVFKNHILIFSDKCCAFDEKANVHTAWIRWRKRTIIDAAKQIEGAENWIKNFPDRICLDAKAECDFPIPIQITVNTKFHRIVVARGAKEACKKYFGGGSGSLIINTDINEKQLSVKLDGGSRNVSREDVNIPLFQVGVLISENKYVHVFDDVTLDIIMNHLDTVHDFTDYLSSKEDWILKGGHIFASGEEEILAHYLSGLNADGKHDLMNKYMNEDASRDIVDAISLCIEEGLWNSFVDSEQYLQWKASNSDSYLWDDIISSNFRHILSGTMLYMHPPTIMDQQVIHAFVAEHSRFERRILSDGILKLRSEAHKHGIAVRMQTPFCSDGAAYVFLVLNYKDISKGKTIEEYRMLRRKLLEDRVFIYKYDFPEYSRFIGIALSNDFSLDSSSEMMYLDDSLWTKEKAEYAQQLKSEYRENGLLAKRVMRVAHVNEYTGSYEVDNSYMKGRNRNSMCPCGSGLKFKKCCGRHAF